MMMAIAVVLLVAGAWQIGAWLSAAAHWAWKHRRPARAHSWKRITFTAPGHCISIIVDANTEAGALAVLYATPHRQVLA